MELQRVADGLDYDIFILGQKSYNGVATLVKKEHGAKLITNQLPNDPPTKTHSRFIDIMARGIRVINIYAPNGNPVFDEHGKHHEKFMYKLDWLSALHDYVAGLIKNETPMVMVGDYNICPEDIDCYDPEKMAGDALLQPQSRAAFRRLQAMGLVDLFRAHHPGEPMCYTYWDYTGGAFQKNNGLRIDHCLATAQLADRMTDIMVDAAPRHAEKPSDHTPVVARFGI